MRPTLEYVKEKFEYYNKLCFDGTLTMPPIRLCLRKQVIGLTSLRDGHIEISVHDDLPEEEYISTIVHEMIHYYIISNGIQDDNPHGIEFCRIMNDIKEKYGIDAGIYYEPTEDELIAKEERRKRHVFVIEYNNGDIAFAVVAKNKLNAIICCISENDDIKAWKHCICDRAIFGAFPVQIIPRFFGIDSDTINRYLTGAQIIESSPED